MYAFAILKYARISPQKTRLVADQIRGKQIEQAMNILQFSTKKSAAILRPVLNSAISNAENKDSSIDIDDLKVTEILVDQGPVMPRRKARARGRAAKIIRRMSHIKITVSTN